MSCFLIPSLHFENTHLLSARPADLGPGLRQGLGPGPEALLPPIGKAKSRHLDIETIIKYTTIFKI